MFILTPKGRLVYHIIVSKSIVQSSACHSLPNTKTALEKQVYTNALAFILSIFVCMLAQQSHSFDNTSYLSMVNTDNEINN